MFLNNQKSWKWVKKKKFWDFLNYPEICMKPDKTLWKPTPMSWRCGWNVFSSIFWFHYLSDTNTKHLFWCDEHLTATVMRFLCKRWDENRMRRPATLMSLNRRSRARSNPSSSSGMKGRKAYATRCNERGWAIQPLSTAFSF